MGSAIMYTIELEGVDTCHSTHAEMDVKREA